MNEDSIRAAFAKVYLSDDALLALAENNRDYHLEAIGARHHWSAFKRGAKTIIAAHEAQRQAGQQEPTEAMIQAGCLSQQATPEYDNYEDWCNSHSGGIVERIRGYLHKDYLAMIAAAPQPAQADKDAEIARILAASRYSADLCTQALGDIKIKDAEIAALKADYGRACRLVADMHMAAMGCVVGPVLGVVEDIAALRKDAERLDFLDRQGEAYGVHEHEGNRWLVEGPFRSIRVAIDADLQAQAVQPRPLTADEHQVMQAAQRDSVEIVHGGKAVQP